MSKTKVFLTLFTFTIIFYLPILSNPNLIFQRNNDLQEFFWPIIYFTKTSLLIHHQLPLWNNLFLSGTPLLPDPQAPLFYLPNILHLFLPLKISLLILLFIHTLFSGIGFYLLARYGFKFSSKTSLILSLFYLTSPKLAGFLEAGHLGLIYSWTWLPLLLLATIKLTQSPTRKWSVLLTLSIAGLFYTHLVTAIIAVVSSLTLYIFILFTTKFATLRSLKHISLGLGLAIGLAAIALLPQLEWQKQTTRSLLLTRPETFPIWSSKLEFLKISILPWLSPQKLLSLDSEKLVPLGSLLSLLALLGFFKLKNRQRLYISILILGIVLIILNNSSPLYSLLTKFKPFIITRVTTRFWFLILFTSLYLAGIALEKLPSKITLLLTIGILTESLLLSWIYLKKPAPPKHNPAPQEIYQFLSTDHDKFRVYCTNRCLSQKTVAEYNLELVEGYNTIQQTNYYQHAWQLTGSYWNYYTLAIPPIGTYQFDQPQPDAQSLGQYNTKYIISTYELSDQGLTPAKKIGNFFIYQNSLLQSRAYTQDNANLPITIFTPNYIQVQIPQPTHQIILAEVYSPGWKAYLNGHIETPILETPNALRAVDTLPDTKFVDFKYQPSSFTQGKIITSLTIPLLALCFFL